ncbi:DEAD-domain-containing protein [Rhizophagus irregularis]|uniref:RNA helicase n=1 Tax=Rhizophagus irregularis TaxID=588596 RepID=A0A2N0Q3Y1_9GLOM|nr:DEAD-domain-containing protein [Rhizophagus irregularis]
MSSDKNQSGFIKKAERRAKLEKLVAAANNKAELKAQVKSCDKSNTKKTEKKRKRNEKEEFFSTSSSNSSLNIIKQDTEKNGYSKIKKKNDAVTNDMDDSSKKDKGKEMELNGKEKKKNKKHKIRRTIKFSEKGKASTYDDDSVFEPKIPKMKNTSTGNSSTDSAVVDEFNKKNEIQITGDLVFNPIMSFTQLNIDESIKGILNKFERPTPIQASCWPICLSGRDVIGIAETGSGKTLAYTVPALKHVKSLSYIPPNNKPLILVVAPTRELAIQIQEQCKEFDPVCGIKSVCIYGGVSKVDQYKALRKSFHIVVATPGRLLDLINEGICDISNVSYLVLDEADRMLDKGFENDIRQIVAKTNKNRQTAMFSATWPESVRKLANDFLNNPMKVVIGSPDLSANNNVTQIVEVIDNPMDKDRCLLNLLKQYHTKKNRILVFVLFKKEAPRVENLLANHGYEVQSIHGDKSQFQRMEVLKAFKDGFYPLLIATDVAARGIDIPNVEYVINYTFPLTIEDYVHRIGRTGRAGNKGISHTLFTSHDKAHSGELINVLRQSNQKIPESLLKFGGGVKKKEHKAYGSFFKEVDLSLKPTKIKFED